MQQSLLFPPTLGRARAAARAQLLAETLARETGIKTQVRVASTYNELEEAVLDGSVDFAWAPPSICAHAEKQGQTILKAVRQGRSMYRSVLVCRKRDDYDLKNLEGCRAAWVDPLSTGGHLLAISTIRQHGLDPATIFRSQEFHGSYQGALLSVIREQADVSSIYVYGLSEKDVRASLSEHVGASEVQLRGFAFTDETPSDGFISTKHSEHADDLIDLLLDDTGNHARNLLLELIDADGLALAEHNDYWAVRQALVER